MLGQRSRRRCSRRWATLVVAEDFDAHLLDRLFDQGEGLEHAGSCASADTRWWTRPATVLLTSPSDAGCPM